MSYNEDTMFFSSLVQCLQLLASPYDHQIQAFPRFVCVPDELALMFDDRYGFSQSLFENKFLDLKQKKMLDEINEALNEMSKDKSIWTIKALKAAKEWEEIRLKANTLLNLLDLHEKLPDLYKTTFIETSLHDEQ